MNLEKKDIALVIDHTFLKDENNNISFNEQTLRVLNLCEEAHSLGAFSVCVRQPLVKVASEKLNELGSSIKICSVIGFPDGDSNTSEEKIDEMKLAKSCGAVEFDMVIRVNDLKLGNEQKVYDDILLVSKEAKDDVLKVIFENVYLNNSQKLKAYNLCKKAFVESKVKGKRFFKTSTGFAKFNGPIGATLEDIKLMHQVSCGEYGIKPAGGINDFDTAVLFWKTIGSPTLKSGAVDPYKYRIGSSSLLLSLFSNASSFGIY